MTGRYKPLGTDLISPENPYRALQQTAERKRSVEQVTISTEQNDLPLIENGTYQATLTDVFRFSNSFGPRIGFDFTLHGRDIEGRTVTRTTTTKLTKKSKLGETLRALTRRGEPVSMSLESLVGTRCIVLIVQQRNRQGNPFNSVDRIFYSMKLA